MVYLRRSNERGPSDLGWLQSRHSFSFSSYYDPAHMGLSALRVINDDQVQPSAGFAAHSHQNMEIISYVKQGAIEHQDSMGNMQLLPAGEFQLMSAGTGVTHSEYNPSDKETLSFLQIWIEPNELGVEPSYQQKRFGRESGMTLIVSPDGRQRTLRIHQDASLYQLLLEQGQTTRHGLSKGRTLYVHVVSGHLNVNEYLLNEGDGIGLANVETIQFSTLGNTEALVFDLP
jgi:redox-sensitive bicupin YhaK (pirin superfamily)